MFKALFTALAAAVFVALSATAAFAQSELDKEKSFANFAGDPSQGTVILRVDKAGHTSVLKLDHSIQNDDDAKKAIAQSFAELPKDKVVRSEIDTNNHGIDSWYFVYNGWSVPFYSYYWNYVPYQPVWYLPTYGYNYYFYGYSWNWGWRAPWYGFYGRRWR